MPAELRNPDAKPFLAELEATEKLVCQRFTAIGKAKSRLARARQAFSGKASISAETHKLVKDLTDLETENSGLGLFRLADSLTKLLKDYREAVHDKLPARVRDLCEAAKIPFKKLTDSYGVGPFGLRLDFAKERASLEYADILLCYDLALSAEAIVDAVTSLTLRLINPKVDLQAFSAQFIEAIRVAVARQGKPLVGTIRAELPKVHQEMVFIRQMANKTSGASQSDDYLRARFVVELRSFMDSDFYVHENDKLRLETAVIEHAKNPKRAIRIPNDIKCGFGEGQTYQAVTLRL